MGRSPGKGFNQLGKRLGSITDLKGTKTRIGSVHVLLGMWAMAECQHFQPPMPALDANWNGCAALACLPQPATGTGFSLKRPGWGWVPPRVLPVPSCDYPVLYRGGVREIACLADYRKGPKVSGEARIG